MELTVADIQLIGPLDQVIGLLWWLLVRGVKVDAEQVVFQSLFLLVSQHVEVCVVFHVVMLVRLAILSRIEVFIHLSIEFWSDKSPLKNSTFPSR